MAKPNPFACVLSQTFKDEDEDNTEQLDTLDEVMQDAAENGEQSRAIKDSRQLNTDLEKSIAK